MRIYREGEGTFFSLHVVSGSVYVHQDYCLIQSDQRLVIHTGTRKSQEINFSSDLAPRSCTYVWVFN